MRTLSHESRAVHRSTGAPAPFPAVGQGGADRPPRGDSRLHCHKLSEIAAALERLDRQGNAELDKAFAAYYPDLKRVARARLRGSGLQGQLQTTALVHESYLKLSAGAGASFADRIHFLAYASRTLRSIIVDTIREERALRRGGARDDLAKLDPGLARLVEMRFIGGMTEPEIAEALAMADRNAAQDPKNAEVATDLISALGQATLVAHRAGDQRLAIQRGREALAVALALLAAEEAREIEDASRRCEEALARP